MSSGTNFGWTGANNEGELPNSGGTRARVSVYDGEWEVLQGQRQDTANVDHHHRYGEALDLRHVTDLINKHQSNSAHCRDEDAVFIMGNTGAGKTTTMNHLCGRKVVSVRDASDGYVVRLDIENPLEGCVVGHGGDSGTRYLHSIVDPAGSSDNNLVFCDTPGFGDTEGSSVDIANAVAISWTIRQCRSVRLVLLIEASMFSSPRGVELSKLLHLFKRFLINADANLNSVRHAVECSTHQRIDVLILCVYACAGASPHHTL
jgi:hypothetical protein